MFPLANMLHLFPHKFARLRRGRLSFALIFPSSFNYFLFWHSKMVSLPEIVLVVILRGALINPGMVAFYIR